MNKTVSTILIGALLLTGFTGCNSKNIAPSVEPTTTSTIQPIESEKPSEANVIYSKYNPIVVNSFLLGGFEKSDGGWFSDEMIFKSIEEKENYKVYVDGKFDGIEEGEKRAGESESADGPLIIGNTIYLSQHGKQLEEDSASYNIIAISSDKDIFTRPVTSLNVNNQTYIDALNEYIKSDNINKLVDVGPIYQTIIQILKFDIDGDGTDEILTVSTSDGNTDKDNALGSIVYMRKLKDGKVENIDAFSNLVRNDDGTGYQMAVFNKVLGVCDLNDDGISEIVMQSWGADYLGFSVLEYINGKFEIVLASGAGA